MSEPTKDPSNQKVPRDASPATVAGAEDDLLAALADDFAARLRAGEHATVEAYAGRHPHLGERIRKAFPAIAMIEESRSANPFITGEHVGGTIGRYKLLEPIGEGGFGVVYMAEQQTPVRRKVALKVVKPGMDSRQILTRFEAERQALAIMDHANIAKVFDGGATESGRPYFVMELVKGEPITSYCDTNQLPPRQRLELFVQVCDAVQHAHQKGIIHRDLKPSNVLVAVHDTTPIVKVIDFGVAKALGQELTDHTLFTGFAQLLGTPLYMSPEQAGHSALDVDTRSDIYSLGVLLYELLTGTTPFDMERFRKAAQDEIRRIIREEEPPRPSTRLSGSKERLPSISAQRQMEPAKLTKLMRGELDWIVMKAMEKDRGRRYQTANGFASDIQRYLADEQVLACPPSTAYRLQKFARRNTAALMTATVVGIALLLAVGSFGWMARDRSARRAKVAGQVELILTEVDQLERAQNWPEALGAARWAEAVLAGGEADAATMQRVRGRLADLAFVDRLERISMRRATTIEGKFDDAGAAQDYAHAFRDYGMDVEALTTGASVERLKTRPTLAIPLASALNDWAIAHWGSRKDHAGATRLVAVARGIDPDPMRDRLRSTWSITKSKARDVLRHAAEALDVRAQPPQTLCILADRLQDVGHSDVALRIRREARAAYPADFWTNFGLAFQLAQQGDHEGAVRFYTAAESIRPNANAALNNLGLSLKKLGRLDEAVAACRRATTIQPDDPISHNTLGLVLHEQQKLDDAVDAYTAAIKIDPQFASAYSNLALVYRDQNKLDLAFDACLTATKLKPASAANHFNLGLVLDALPGRRGEAIVAYRTAIKLDPEDAAAYAALFDALDVENKRDQAMEASDQLTKLDPKEPRYARHFSRRGSILFERNDLDGQLAAFRKAAELDPKNAKYHYNVSVVLQKKGQVGEAIAACERAVELDPRDGKICLQLAWLLYVDPRFRDAGRAVALARRAIELTPAANVEGLTQRWQTLGWALYYAGDWKGSVAALERSMALQPSPKGGDPGQWFCLAMDHWQLGDQAEARRWYHRAVAWMEENNPEHTEFNGFRVEAGELLGVNEQ